jgi:hypothetical protein
LLPSRPFNERAKDVGWRASPNTPGVHPGWERLGPQEASRKLRELANHIDGRTEPVPADTNMLLARQMAAHVVSDPGLPASVAGMTPDQKADLLAAVDKEPRDRLPVSWDDYEPFTRIATLFGRIGMMTEARIHDVPDALQRINIVLRMWAGCLDAGKAIAEETRSGPNTSTIRAQKVQQVEASANGDPVYAAGIEASVIIKGRRGEKMSFAGVPVGTRIHELQKLLPSP